MKDMAAHLLDTDIQRLSFRGDRLASRRPIQNYQDLVEHINLLNEEWVSAARRIGPQLLLEFLTITGPQVYEVFKSLDPFAQAGASVAWAGEHESLNWFDTAREYSEKWVHQQQIRDAVGRPGLTSYKGLHPVLDTFLRGLPHTFREIDAPYYGLKTGKRFRSVSYISEDVSLEYIRIHCLIPPDQLEY